MKPNLNEWDDTKLHDRVHPEDIPIIKNTRLRLFKAPDVPTWIFTKDGQYSVKSGYHQLTKPGTEHFLPNHTMTTLWKQLWKLNIPPKIKHFWWRVMHNALPVANNLARRRLKVIPDCIFCGDAQESILHLLFQCRFAKEVWELSPLHIEPGQLESRDLLDDIMQYLFKSSNQAMSKEYLFPFIGWRLWKARNELFFNNKRWAIPEIIHNAMMDFKLWTDSQAIPNISLLKHGKSKATTLQEIMHHTSSFVCCVDASWLDSQSRAGIGWILYSPQGRCVLRGFSSVAPVTTALEAEALALKEALFHLRRLNYVDVTFCGDSMLLYCHLEKIKKMPHSVPGCLEIQSYLDDITALSLSSFDFKFICRNDNSVADLLAKLARSQNLPFTISWEY
ncbi:Reverse transcriptase zinc-binding domain [Arabidopsis suecica]|uniref:Reverse transcriptase zinc-binding domain n=1 Tax=Arabidopsis suecica TaxID=45249 RepID=A0A8T1XRF0_ARASU|nr:Reverse transcriptase zinc-binding domain [Arabidopsis suecica]